MSWKRTKSVPVQLLFSFNIIFSTINMSIIVRNRKQRLIFHESSFLLETEFKHEWLDYNGRMNERNIPLSLASVSIVKYDLSELMKCVGKRSTIRYIRSKHISVICSKQWKAPHYRIAPHISITRL